MAYFVILGPTASGKTSKAVALARRIDAEIISADSRQIYCGMDIGSGKDIADYGNVRYHLIDIRPAGYKYNLFEFLRDEQKVRADIIRRGHTPLLCGGTGMYIENVLRGQSLPEVGCNQELRRRLADKTIEELSDILASLTTLHNVSDLDTRNRAIRAIEIAEFVKDNPNVNPQGCSKPMCDAVVIGLDIDRESRRRRISLRLDARLKAGMIDEVKRLIDSGVDPQALIDYGLEYRFITQYLLGKFASMAEMRDLLEIAIHQFAKRQMTWFRGMERRGIKINWLPFDMPDCEFCEAAISLAHEV